MSTIRKKQWGVKRCRNNPQEWGKCIDSDIFFQYIFSVNVFIYSNIEKPGYLDQVRDNPPEADQNRTSWGAGIMECWSDGILVFKDVSQF